MNKLTCPLCGRECSKVEEVDGRVKGYCNHGNVANQLLPVIDTLTIKPQVVKSSKKGEDEK